MSVISELIIDLIVSFLSYCIYGTEERPRHWVWRYSVRAIAFIGGAFVLAAVLSLSWVIYPSGLWLLLWFPCMVTVVFAEFHLGSWRVGIGAVALSAAIGVAFWLT
ncbi:hypothetical protein GCM10007939_25110 [Amylibacter marinus]|uniref:DUF3325 domain-containing protein n=1 Tax=Amylibacter marinus TaxID=1475483 RepID=A0ABQ5VYE9_9RHOB|nr:hypothetical protein [Amylibacter marinus]GLQ36227.1 hypothetical protein GCM10007939_25110 [Amylibacter marinus]